MAAEFQGQFQEAMRELEMADLKKEVQDAASGLNAKFDPLNFGDTPANADATGHEPTATPAAGEPAPAEPAQTVSAQTESAPANLAGVEPASAAPPPAAPPGPAEVAASTVPSGPPVTDVQSTPPDGADAPPPKAEGTPGA
jgi:sec-independent protein translocase protein TatB